MARASIEDDKTKLAWNLPPELLPKNRVKLLLNLLLIGSQSIPRGGTLSVPGHHIMWIVGAATLDEALKRLEPFKLDGVVQKMRCPFLVVHGADDEQIPLADAQALYDACGSQDKTLRVFTGEEGGAQHCQRDYLTLGCATMWDWFEDKLVRA